MITEVPKIAYSHGSITGILQKFEQEFPVANWRIADLQIWPIIRIRLYQLLASTESGQTIPKETSVFAKIASIPVRFKNRIISICRKKLFSQFHIPRKTDVLLFSPAGRRFLLGNKLFHKFFDPLMHTLFSNGYRGYVVEQPERTKSQYRKYNNQWTQIIHDVPERYLKSEREQSASYAVSAMRFEDFIQALRLSEFGGYADNLSITEIIPIIVYIRAASKMMTQAIERSRTRLCIVDCFYHWTAFALIKACRDRKILTVELQHGVQGNQHPAYAPWLNQPEGGFDFFPDLFWCWDKASADNIQTWRPRESVIMGGNPALTFWLTEAAAAHLQRYKETMRSLNHNAERNILITLSAGQLLPEWFGDVMLGSPVGVFWWLRLHPLQKKEELVTLDWLKNPTVLAKVNIEDATRLPLHAILQYVDLHVTKFSSCILEAEFFGVPSITYFEECLHMFPEQQKNGSLILTTTIQDFQKALLKSSRSTVNHSGYPIHDPGVMILRILKKTRLVHT